MEIHSSSLSFYPTRINQSQSGKSNSDGMGDREFNVIKKANESPRQLNEVNLTTEQLKKELLGQIRPFNQAGNIDNLVNVRTQKALNSYTNTVNQPLHEQRAQLTGIDFYV